jgi:hypothetical protein
MVAIPFQGASKPLSKVSSALEENIYDSFDSSGKL